MKIPRILTARIGAFLLAATPAFAATWTWTGAAGNNSWNNSGNWSPVVQPANDGTANIIFSAVGAPRTSPDLTLNWNVNSVTFINTVGQFNLFSTLGNTLTIGAGGITNNDANNHRIDHAITLGAAQIWNAALGLLRVYGAVNNGGNLLTINSETPRFFSIYGVISGSGGLTKNGPGDLFVVGGASNTYTGTTTVNAGQLVLQGGGPGMIPGALDIGDSAGMAIDTVTHFGSNQIADTATVSVFSTGAWSLNGSASETITNLDIFSTGVAGGAVVTIGDGSLTIIGSMSMRGGTVTASGTGKLLLNGDLTCNGSDAAASISSKLDLGGGTRTIYVTDSIGVADDLVVSGVVSNGGIIKDGPGVLRLGAANTHAGGTTLNAGTLLIGHDSALATGLLTVNGGTLQAGGAARSIANAVALGGSAAVDGAFDVTLTGPVSGSGGLTKNGSGTLTFTNVGIISGALTVNAGTVRFNADFTAGGGLANSATVIVGTQTLTVNGPGLNNQGSLPLAGGTLAGSGPVVNDGLIQGNGTIGGGGGFTNNAQLTVSGGSLTLAKAGANANSGNVSVPSGLQLRLTGGPLANTGTVDLAGGIVAGTATLSNNAGGTVTGRGLISAPFANAGGTLRALGATMNVTNAFTSSGVIWLDDAAGLTGGAITNTGRIQGDGTISNALTNAAGGSIRVDAGKTLFFRGTFAPNVGELNLQGGTLDFAAAVTNAATGFIAGRGALYTGGLTNNGQIAFSGGTADIHGDVALTSGSRVVTSGAGSVTTFFDDVTHNGLEIFTGVNTSTVFYGSQSGAGNFTGSGTIYFIGDLRPGSSPAVITFAPQVVLTPSNTLTMEIGGRTPGPGMPVNNGYDKLVFTRAGAPQITWSGRLVIELINGFAPAAGDAFDVFDFDAARDAGTFSSVTVVDHGLLPPGLTFDFDELYTTGIIRVVSTTGATFAQWAAAELGDPGAFPGGNHDGDGYDNLTEYALALFPAFPGASEPSGGFHIYVEGERMRVLFGRHIDRTDITIRVQVSTDLTNWGDLAVSVNSAPFTGAGFVSEDRLHPLTEPGLVEVRDTADTSAGVRRYLRIVVTLAD